MLLKNKRAACPLPSCVERRMFLSIGEALFTLGAELLRPCIPPCLGTSRPSLLKRRTIGNEREPHILYFFGAGRLRFTYPEHLRPAGGTRALSCRSPILHGYGLGTLHLSLRSALHAVGFHPAPPKYCARYIVNSCDAKFLPLRYTISSNSEMTLCQLCHPPEGRSYCCWAIVT